MKYSFLIVAALFVNAAGAQPNRWFDFLVQVKQFLQLTDSQAQTILANNEEYNRLSFDKQARIRQVQVELAEETAKNPLDPNALGIRYAEIETNCREMKIRASEIRTRNVDILSQEQKAKLKTLEEAVKLAPVISEAQSGNLIGGFTSPPYSFTSASNRIGGSLIGGILGPANGCYQPIPTAVIRTGDFTFNQKAGIPRATPGSR